MARSDWGGTSGDLSGTFNGLINQQISQSVSAANRAINQSQDQQDAADQDMYSKWKNGLISDQQWLDYIATRVDATKGDPKQHEQWVDTQRQYTNSIADSQIESAYTRGEVSLNDVIAHYSTRLAGLQPNSDEYRNLQDHYYQLVDKRDGDYIDTVSRDILARIARGKTGYGELMNFYQSMNKKVRSSSALKSQLAANIQSIQDIIDGVSGGRSGGGGGGGGRSKSGGSSTGANDPYSVASRATLKLWTSGNVFNPQGSNVVQSVLDVYNTDLKDKSAVWNALAEDSAVIENLMSDAQNHPDEAYLTTPWGERIPNTPQMRQMIMNQGLRTYDYRIALGNAEGKSIVGIQNARHTFVDSTFRKENDINAETYWSQVRQDVWEGLTLASQDPNPDSALQSYRVEGNALEKATHQLLGEKAIPNVAPHGAESVVTPGTSAKSDVTGYAASTLFPEQQLSSDMQKDIQFAGKLAQLLKAAPNMTSDQFQHEASILSDQRPTAFWLKDTDLTQILGSKQVTSSITGFGNDVQVGQGVLGKIAASEGLKADSAVNAGQPSVGVEPYVYVGLPGATPMAVPRSMVGQVLGIKGDLSVNTRGGWETVGGQTSWVVRPLQDVPVPKWYVDQNGRYMTAAQYSALGKNRDAISAAGWQYKPVQELSGWKQIVDGEGKTWYVDPEDGHLYQTLPLKAGITGPVFDASHLVNDRGVIDINNLREPASTDMGFVTWWTSDIPRSQVEKMTQDLIQNDQSLIAAGIMDPKDQHVNLDLFHKRDPISNDVSAQGLSENDVNGMFWTPADQLLEWRHQEQAGAYDQPETQLQTWYRTELRRRAALQDAFDKGYGNVKQAFLQHQQDQQQGILPPSIQDGLRAAGISLGKAQDLQQQEANGGSRFNVPSPTQTIRTVAPVSLDSIPVPKPPHQAPPYVPPVQVPVLPTPPKQKYTPPPPTTTAAPTGSKYAGKQVPL